MKTKKGGISLNQPGRRKLDKRNASFAAKGRHRVGRAIIELLGDYEGCLTIERVPNKIRDHLREDWRLTKPEIVWYTKVLIWGLEAGGIIEQYLDFYKRPAIRLR